MSTEFDLRKKRPPPIIIPAVPAFAARRQAAHIQTDNHEQRERQQQQQRQQAVTKNSSSSAQQAPEAASSSLTWPLEHDRTCFPLPNSGSQKSRTSAMTNLTDLMGQARMSPPKSEGGTNSTTRSKPSTRSRQSAQSAQAYLESLDGDSRTSRAKIEARTEQHVLKMSGQVPPTPLANTVGDNEVLILTTDLRKQCRAASEEHQQQPPHQEVIKSPKKKLFGMQLPNFGRSSTPVPAMPSKAAQVLGQAPRNPTKVVVRPLKPAGPFKTPTKAPRCDTAKSLPAKLVNPDSSTRSHHTGTARPIPDVNRRPPPRIEEQPSNSPPEAPALNSSFDSGPPTPPAKDTPPDVRAAPVEPTSPLRRTAPSNRLRESYGADGNAVGQLRLLDFALSPSRTKSYASDNAGQSPTKRIPSTADDYKRLIAGQPQFWPSPTRDNRPSEVEDESLPSVRGQSEGEPEVVVKDFGQQDQPTGGGVLSSRLSGPPQFPLLTGRKSEDYPYQYSDRGSLHYSPLPPRFYSPSNRSVQDFAAGETPSKNSDTTRFLCTITSKGNLGHLRADSSNGSIEMVYQGDATDIDPQSSTGRLIHHGDQTTTLQRDDSELATRVMQELRVGEQASHPLGPNGSHGQLHFDPSSSRLTEILNGIGPQRDDSQSRFQPNCPSAVPSPLHRGPPHVVTMQSVLPRLNSSGLVSAVGPSKSIDDHFYMTNEHLDVVGKSSWDQIETLKKELCETVSTKHGQLVSTVEKHMQDVRMQMDSVKEKTNGTAEQGHKMHTRLEQLFDFIRDDVMGALAAQDQKTVSLEQSVKELQKAVQSMQKTMEQKQADAKTSQPAPQSTGSPFPPRPQASLAGYYANMSESSREGQAPLSHVPDRNSSFFAYDGHNDTRAGYGGNLGQNWPPRPAYQGRNGREDRSYSGSSPYQFANNAAHGGQLGNGYNGGSYSPYSPAEPHHGFHAGPAK
ncbi:hypothetical protein ACEQ8H_007205 [Pleosporales sp. CAS-2024a]